MKSATKKTIQKELVPYIHLDGIFPYIEFKDVHKITAKLLEEYSNIYCGISGSETECPVFIVKSKKNHTVLLKIIIEREFLEKH